MEKKYTKSEFIKELRLKKRLSRPKMAELLNISISSIEKVETDRVIINSSTKYVQGICALYGYNPKIFDYDEISQSIINTLELSKFSKAIIKYLYFSIGDIYDKGAFEIYNILISQLSIDISYNECFIENIKEYVLNARSYEFYIFDENSHIYAFSHLLTLLGLNKFKPSYFLDLEYKHYLETLQYGGYLCQTLTCNNCDFLSHFDANEIINKLTNLEKNGLDLTIENIKKLSKYKELKELKNKVKQLEKELNITPAEVVPADNKASEICTLLEYAPEPFKDKLLNKLREYKKDIEEL